MPNHHTPRSDELDLAHALLDDFGVPVGTDEAIEEYGGRLMVRLQWVLKTHPGFSRVGHDRRKNTTRPPGSKP